jgi:hypothetical protein
MLKTSQALDVGSIRIACGSFLFVFQCITKFLKGTKALSNHVEYIIR